MEEQCGREGDAEAPVLDDDPLQAERQFADGAIRGEPVRPQVLVLERDAERLRTGHAGRGRVGAPLRLPGELRLHLRGAKCSYISASACTRHLLACASLWCA